MAKSKLVLGVLLVGAILFLLLLSHASSPSYAQDPTPTQRPVPPLTHPNPSLDELGDYLSTLFGYSVAVSEQSLMFIDLNGDQTDDLVIHGAMFVVAMLWDGNQYVSPAFVYLPYGTSLYDSSALQLQDLTGDGHPDVIYDERLRSAGTGLLAFSWHRYVISCQALVCSLAWDGTYASIQTNYESGNMRRTDTDFEVAMVNSTPTIITTTSGIETGQFWFYGVNSPPAFGLNSHPVIRREYLWDGVEFVLSSEQVLEEESWISKWGQKHAENQSGGIARIAIEHRDHKDDRCILSIDQISVESLARCKSEFVDVEWQDVTGDGIEEAIFVLTATNRQGVDDYLDYDCVHQRLLVFQILDDKYARIADIDGCVSQSDLFGVRIEDVDGDGTLEIRSAGDWFDFAVPDAPMRYTYWFDFNTQDFVYRFNGVKYIQANTLPRQ